MKTYDIAVIGGDGTGPEVTTEALKVSEAAAKKFGNYAAITNSDITISYDHGPNTTVFSSACLTWWPASSCW